MTSHPPAIGLDQRVTLEPPVYFNEPVSVLAGSKLVNCSVDAFSYIALNCTLENIEIGRYCQLGNEVCVLNEHPSDWLTSHPFAYNNQKIFPAPFTWERFTPFERSQPIKVGNDVWIGNRVQIKMGVTIGDGAIIGAGAVVTKDVAPFAIVAGVPARQIRLRFEPAVIERILAVQWWQYNLLGQDINWQEPMRALDQIEALAAAGTLLPYKPDCLAVSQRTTT